MPVLAPDTPPRELDRQNAFNLGNMWGGAFVPFTPPPGDDGWNDREIPEDSMEF